MAVPTMTNNSPALGSIAWGTFNIQYMGVTYNIPAASTSNRWVWWVYNNGSPFLESGADVPSYLTTDDVVLFGNKNGIGVRIQSAGVVDGELIVDGSILAKSLSVEAVDADYLIANDALIKGLLRATETVSLAVSTNGLFVGDNISLTKEGGLVVESALGNTILPADGGAPQFTGEATFQALTTKGNLKIEGLTNEVAKGSVLRLASGTTAPKGAPVGSAYWPSKPVHEGFTPRGWVYHPTSGRYLTVESVYGAGIASSTEQAGKFNLEINGTPISGADGWNRKEVQSGVGGLTILGNNIFILCSTNEAISGTYLPRWWIYKGVWNATNNNWDFVGRYEYMPPSQNFLAGYSRYNPVIGVRAATNEIIITQCGDGGQVWRSDYNSSGTFVRRVAVFDSNSNHWVAARNFVAGTYLTGDLGVERLMLVREGEAIARFWDVSSMVHQPAQDFPLATGAPIGVMWDPAKGIFRSRSGQVAYDHGNILSNSMSAAMTWRKADGVAPDYAQYETDKSRIWVTSTFPKRASLLLNSGLIPDDITDANDPDSVSFYIALNNTAPTNDALKRVATPAIGVQEARFSSISAAGGPPPAAPNFPAATPARILSDDGVTLDIRGTGQWKLGDISGQTDGRVVGGAFVPIGGAIPYFGASQPVGWLFLNGQLVYEAAYPLLFNHLLAAGATATGTAPNRTIPLWDSRDRFIGGAGPVRPLYTSGGSDTVTMPDHTHPFSGTTGAPPVEQRPGRATGTPTTAGPTHSHDFSGNTGAVNGTNPAIGNVPKYLMANYIIRAA